MERQNRIKERLLKIYSLATDGVDGERDAAQRLLDENLKKYGLNISDLIGSDSEVNEIYWFAVKDKYQRRLLEQLYGVFIVKDNQYTEYSNKALRYNVGLKMTKSQKVELTLMYDFYLTQWKKEIEKQKDILFRAFISKHSLSNSYADYDKMSDDELKLAERACRMMDDLEDVSFKKQIGSGQLELNM